MARGWESKSVESQIESARERPAPHIPAESEETAAKKRERESIQLSRVRVLNDLASAHNPKYQELLRRSLQFLDDKLAVLDSAISRPDRPE